MKKIIFLMFILFPVLVLSQTKAVNYIKTTTYKVPAQTSIPAPTIIQANQNINYFDGLGRPIQQIAHQQSPTGADVVTPIIYDGYGRQEKDYLPYVSNVPASLNYNTNAFAEVGTFYNTGLYENTTNPYSQKGFEKSPLNRVLSQAAPGEDWKMGNGHEIRFDYQTNISDDQVRIYGVSFTAGNIEDPKLTNLGFYPVSKLYKIISKDENWQENQSNAKDNTSEEFKDKQGRLLLKRKYGTVGVGTTTEKYDTYYVYDDFGNLTFVIPPKAADIIGNSSSNILADETSSAKINAQSVPLNIRATNSIRLIDGFHAQAGSIFTAVITVSTDNILDNLCYQYRYDSRKRLVEKKMPGKDWEYIVYDKLNRPVLTQDANLRVNKKWMFTKYDLFNRPVYTGEYVNNVETTRSAVQGLANSSVLFESRQTVAQIIAGTAVNYSNLAFPNSGINLFTISYYDDYLNVDLYNGTAANALSYGITPMTNAKGLVTCSKIRVLNTNSWITSVIYYDGKSRPIYNYNKNIFLDIESTVKSKLDFTGKILETTSTHQKGANAVITIIDIFAYDDMGRMLTQKQKINTQDPELIVSNTYDSLGKLITKGVGGKVSNSNRLQNINFTYNIRGWLKGINDSDSNNATITLSDSSLFGFQISYNKPSSGKGLYNGNISQTFWKSANGDNSLKSYNYSYDVLNRLSNAADNLGKFNESMQYDKNGNITYLKRLGEIVGGNIVPDINVPSHFGVMDDLTYTYDLGNRLMKVADSAPIDEFGFKDDAVNTAADTQDDYSYDKNGNMLTDSNKGIIGISYNHLNLPEKITSNAGIIDYVYDAAGVKQQKTVNNMVTNYAVGFVYENGILKFISQPEGYIVNNGGTFDYIYQYLDHLGNVRLSYGDADNNGVITNTEIIEENNYYPFGLKHKGYNYVTRIGKGNATAQRYKYNGKELQDENVNGFQLNFYDYGARNYDPALGRWMNFDPLAEKGRRWSPYNYAMDNPAYFIDPDGMWPDPPIGFNASLRISFSSSGLSFKANASIGVGTGGSNLQGVGFAGVSVYAGNQLGTSSMARGIQFDATAGAYATLGAGNGNSHVVNTLNPDTPSGLTNDFKTSITYGQMFTYSSAINAERGPRDGEAIQRLAIIGLKGADISFTTSNDTGIMGGGDTDKGQTGNGTLNVGGANGFSLSYLNYTGSYDMNQSNDMKASTFVGYGQYYKQTPYQQSLNQSAFRIDALGNSVIGGTSNGSIQNGIHSQTNTGLFIYPNSTMNSSGLFNLFYSY
ncbi:DUF6443 domain-containing protein [Flavobacterium sp. Root186]|uniref:DUF6443 domain-containing protein n=1 Tax=Flavobacterium sp. Root186 TaxID=1736485 RepID=UPI0009EB1A64|nr:DUF6443 domain-containing protein [Flavobacterium sp. Root186]